MTISTEVSYVVYTGNGSTDEFSVTFPVFQKSDLVVTLITIATGVETVVDPAAYDWTPDEDYTGIVTYPSTGTAISSAYQVRIEQLVDFTQELELNNQRTFNPAAIEEQFDKVVMQTKQLKRMRDNLVAELAEIDTRIDALELGASPTLTTYTDYLDQLLAVNPMSPRFGAVGDGVADDSGALSAALTEALSLGLNLYIPPGDYLLNSRVTMTMGNTQDIKIFGDGRLSRLLVNNATGGVRVILGTRCHVEWADMTVEPARTGGNGSGHGLWFDGPAGSAIDKNMVIVRNVSFVPFNQNTSEGWYNTYVLRVTGCKRPRIEDVTYSQGDGAPHAGKMTALIDISESYNVVILNTHVKGRATYGILQDQNGEGNEGLTIESCTISKADYGIYYADTARSPDLRIVNTHVNSLIENVHIDGMKSGLIHGNLFYINLDEITYTYTRTGTTTVNVVSDQPHLFSVSDTFTIDSTTGGLVAGDYTVVSAPTSTTFTFTTVASTTISGSLVIATESSRDFIDIHLLSAEGVSIRNNNYQVAKATSRRHVYASIGSSIGSSPVIRDIRISDEILQAESSLAAYYFGAAASNVLIEVEKAAGQGSYSAGFGEFHASATDCELIFRDRLLSKSFTPSSSDGANKALQTFALTPGILVGNRGLRVETGGTFANNANAKTVRFDFGSQFYSASMPTGVAGFWEANFKIYRTGVNAQRYVLTVLVNGVTTQAVAVGTLTETETSNISVRVTTGAATALNDLTATHMTVEFI